MSKEQTSLDKIVIARQIISEAVETSNGVKDPTDKLTALKTGYRMAITYAPDPTERKKNQLKLDTIDNYMTRLASLRTQNSYLLEHHKTPRLIKRDKELDKRQHALIKFQEYNLRHGRVYIDNILILNIKGQIIKMTSDQFLAYIKPYRQYLHKEALKLRPNIKLKD